MKRTLCLCLVLLFVCCALASADDQWKSNHGILTKYKGTYGDITVPGFLDGAAVIAVGENLLNGCSAITGVEISAGIQSIGWGAFYSCQSLASVTFSDSLQVIASHAFYSCRGLTELDIPASVGFIGDNAFSLCEGVTSVTFAGNVPAMSADAFGQMDNATFFVPDDLLDEYRASLPAGSNVVGSGKSAVPYEYAFTDYEFDAATGTLTSYSGTNAVIVVPDEIDGVPVTAIGDHAFRQNWSAYRIDIPEGVNTIGKGAFSNAWRLATVNLPSTLRSIADEGFYHYPGYAISLPEGLETIGNSAFFKSSLRKLVVPEGVRTIGDSAFERASYLSELQLPSTIETIGNRAFADTALRSIRMDGDHLPTWGEDVFAGVPLDGAEEISLILNPSKDNPAPLPSETTPALEPIKADSLPIEFGVKYICKAIDVEGITFDASLLGAEYSVTIDEDGTAKCIFSGIEMAAMPWAETDDGLILDYFGIVYKVSYTETGFDLQYAENMILHFGSM